MQNALAAFNRSADEIVRTFVSSIESAPTPPLIYHYTKPAGLEGILNSGTIWLSDVFALNDPSELSHGFSQLNAVLKTKVSDALPETKVFAQFFDAFLTQGGIQASAHYFTCSFSTNGDELGQWRAYSDNAHGYALGFETKGFETSFAAPNGSVNPNNSTFPITYDDARLEIIYKQIVDLAAPLISLPRGKRLTNDQIRAYMSELSVYLSMHALRAAIFFKHEGYVSESEYRFFQIFRADVPPPAVKLRGAPPIKYREFDWRTEAQATLKRIIVGPAADFAVAQKCAQHALDRAGISGVEIVPSKIPYRVVT
jgi:hypothetical protein